MPKVTEFFRRLAESAEGALSSFHLEAKRLGGGMSLTVFGVIGVSEFTNNEIFLLSHKARVRIFGERLALITLENRIVEVRGKISGVEFSYGKN